MLSPVLLRNGDATVFVGWIETSAMYAAINDPWRYVSGPAFDRAEAGRVVDWINTVAARHIVQGGVVGEITLALWEDENTIVLVEDHDGPSETVTRIDADRHDRFTIGTDGWGWQLRGVLAP